MISKKKVGVLILAGIFATSNYMWYNHTKDLETKLESRSQAIETLDTSIKKQGEYVQELKIQLHEKEDALREAEGKIQKAQQISYRTMQVKVTAYNEDDGMCGSTTMANGEHVYVGACALNGVPLNSHIRYNGQIYKVCDRVGMDGVLDLYLGSVQECNEFGVRYATIEILD